MHIANRRNIAWILMNSSIFPHTLQELNTILQLDATNFTINIFVCESGQNDFCLPRTTKRGERESIKGIGKSSDCFECRATYSMILAKLRLSGFSVKTWSMKPQNLTGGQLSLDTSSHEVGYYDWMLSNKRGPLGKNEVLDPLQAEYLTLEYENMATARAWIQSISEHLPTIEAIFCYNPQYSVTEL